MLGYKVSNIVQKVVTSFSFLLLIHSQFEDCVATKNCSTLTSGVPTPKAFVKYLIDVTKRHDYATGHPPPINPHFLPQAFFCHFCEIDYDFIGDIQNMDSDMDFLSELLGFKVYMNCIFSRFCCSYHNI